MKRLVILGCMLCLGLSGFTQGFSVDFVDQNKILYRGYENKLTLNPIGCEVDDYQIQPVNCEITKLATAEHENTYIIKPDPAAKTANIQIIAEGKTVDNIAFVVQNLPQPALYWGYQKSGSNVSDSKEIQLKYAPGVALEANFKIMGWLCNQNNQRFIGKGNLLSADFLAFAKSIPTGESIQIEVSVMGADGIIRKMTGSWLKE